MRGAALVRISAASAAVLGCTMAMAIPLVHLQPVVPVHHLRIAWTVMRLLVQL